MQSPLKLARTAAGPCRRCFFAQNAHYQTNPVSFSDTRILFPHIAGYQTNPIPFPNTYRKAPSRTHAVTIEFSCS